MLLFLILFLGGVASIPYSFQSSSILYKFGTDRLLLRSGKIFGLMAFSLVLFQVASGTRLKFPDRIFSLNKVFRFHRICGLVIAGLAITHPILILASENMLFIPFKMRYWPEFTGVFLLMGLICTGVVSTLRKVMGLPFHLWFKMHQWVAPVLLALLFVHVLFVSETFETGLPHTLVFLSTGICGILWIRHKIRPFLSKPAFEVTSVEPAGKEAWRLNLVRVSGRAFQYNSGQFGFFRFQSPNISSEEHPFSISSSPTRPDGIELVVREGGDWTRLVSRIEPGTRCRVDGPYGLFSHAQCPKGSELIMIAGGIGITPMLSMVRYMADTRDDRKTLLIWSSKTREHDFFQNEFEGFGHSLINLRVIRVFTRDTEAFGENGRLDKPRLKRLVSGMTTSSYVYICGPPEMMKDTGKWLIELEFLKNRIFTENFGL
ncbi:MAG: ferric reductase-like transmembrane domain-containing protein [Proteobacteria bacterium]|nr:ferric reductase-like transmembrane domain-containing protein [Pseudomonadota bacterium]